MEKNMTDKKLPLILDHGKPRTRREFLAQGLIGFSALTAAPTLMGLLMKSAHARTTGMTPMVDGSLPFFVFDMAGGAGLPGNFLVGKAGGPMDLLPAYDLLGWNPRDAGALYTDFGLPMSAKYSRMLAGILENTTPEARANFRMTSLCHFGQDDSSGNKLNASTLVLNATQPGQYLSNGLGVVNSISGGNSSLALDDVAMKATFVQSFDDILGATKFGGQPYSDFSVNQLRAMAKGNQALGAMQGDSLSGMPGGEVLKELSGDAYAKALELVEGVASVDPRQNADISAIYGITTATAVTDKSLIAAALVLNSITGACGPSTWTLGGCDYHDSTQTTGDGKDYEMGVQIGRAIQTAYKLARPLFFQIITDGGVEASRGTRMWGSDSGDKSMTVMGFYHPKAAPKIRDGRMQIGYYADGQGVERTTLIGATPLLACYAVFANYLNCMGKLDQFHTYLPGVFTGAGELDSVLTFEGPVA